MCLVIYAPCSSKISGMSLDPPGLICTHSLVETQVLPGWIIREASVDCAAGEGSENQSVSEDTIKDVFVDDNVRLDAIAEEVQNSWRLKEIRAEQLMQKAVARSERPWLILLSGLFTASVVLLVLVLYRLYSLDHKILGWLSMRIFR